MQWITLSLCLLVYCGQAQAKFGEHFFFTTDWGEEIRVENISRNKVPNYLIYTQSQQHIQQLFKQLLKSTLAQHNYVYTDQEDCTDSCQLQKVFFTDIRDWPNLLVEAAALAFATRELEVLARELTQNPTIDESVFHVLFSQSNKPLSLCHYTQQTCVSEPSLIFGDAGKYGWTASFSMYGPGQPKFNVKQNISNALHRFILNHNPLDCNTVYTNTVSDPIAELSCLPKKKK